MTEPESTAAPERRWQVLSAIERRVAGVLVEKAKTTPETYPLSLNAVVTACNQKNNRFPTTELDADAVEEALGRLRGMGAVALVQGGSRIDRYRHLLYEWLGVDKVEMAVMAELLLRGAQTEGELRGRAARMEPIADLPALRPVLDSLRSKGLIISLTPSGRGHVLSHALYQPRELERLRAEHGAVTGASPSGEPLAQAPSPSSARPATQQSASPHAAAYSTPPAPAPFAAPLPRSAADSAELGNLRSELRQLQETVSELQSSLDDCRRELRELREALGA